MSRNEKGELKKSCKSRKKIKEGESNGQASPECDDAPADSESEPRGNEASLENEAVRGNGNEPPDSSRLPDSQEASEECIDWPEKDLNELIDRMQTALPQKDTLAYNTRVEKLSWTNIAFKEYTAEECKKTWHLLQKKIRRFRLLNELLHDAKELITKPLNNLYRSKNIVKRHPDMPRKPLSVYMLFYLKKKDKILREKPGMELTEVSKIITQMYKNITPEKREKYVQLAAEQRRQYERSMEEFYRQHPDIWRQAQTEKLHPVKATKRKGPPKPATPFTLFFEDQLKKLDSSSNIDRVTYKERCKEEWKTLADDKKLVWIDGALQKESQYWEDLKDYQAFNPNYEPKGNKHILSKEEKLLKQRLSGKPIKPPNSAYSLFSRMMLKGAEIKKIDSKDRMKVVALQWKNCSEKEKSRYKEQTTQLLEKYKVDFASYLQSLPEDKRQEELQKLKNDVPKRKNKDTNEEEKKEEEPPPTNVNKRKFKEEPPLQQESNVPIKEEIVDREEESQDTETEVPKKKPKLDEENTEEDEEIQSEKKKSGNIFDEEPEPPPVSAFLLYCSKYRGKSVTAEVAWRKLNKMVKQRLEDEVKRLKQQYIKEYGKFLKSLSKEQLLAFTEMKKKRDIAALEIKMEKKEIKSEDESQNSDDSNSENNENHESNENHENNRSSSEENHQ